ncbi:chemotaxis protein methyltransferase CheR/type IV pilus assembly protein PilK [Thiohalophilus thiocyanatoxydans]|uniref:protein-glutamate O-methyltransferase n=1 Tax=Thiohalophilus thiocyanatoxydans TaxID=381308 RepID=A0A4R8IUR7_9GAMM|nr:chemotaxis protein methyltransferase CheR/type IV pilus assembly protein PilK [Thiohalophilus thiocyanatoxydans]
MNYAIQLPVSVCRNNNRTVLEERRLTAVLDKPVPLSSPSETMDEAQFSRWANLLERRTGIYLPSRRRSFLISSLNIRMQELGIADYETYFNYLTTGARGAVEWEILVDRLTVHETRFYRDEQALAVVRQHARQWLEQHPSSSERFDIWSVGCATGEEAYSLAILLDDLFIHSGSCAYLGITATDVSSAALTAGRKGVYHYHRIKNLPESFQTHYFEALDEQHVQVIPELQRRVCFMRQNLLELGQSRIGKMDIIFCQNVLIYFPRERRLEILDYLAEHLKPGGLLVLGAGEIIDWHNPLVQAESRQGALAYRRSALETEA